MVDTGRHQASASPLNRSLRTIIHAVQSLASTNCCSLPPQPHRRPWLASLVHLSSHNPIKEGHIRVLNPPLETYEMGYATWIRRRKTAQMDVVIAVVVVESLVVVAAMSRRKVATETLTTVSWGCRLASSTHRINLKSASNQNPTRH